MLYVRCTNEHYPLGYLLRVSNSRIHKNTNVRVFQRNDVVLHRFKKNNNTVVIKMHVFKVHVKSVNPHVTCIKSLCTLVRGWSRDKWSTGALVSLLFTKTGFLQQTDFKCPLKEPVVSPTPQISFFIF